MGNRWNGTGQVKGMETDMVNHEKEGEEVISGLYAMYMW